MSQIRLFNAPETPELAAAQIDRRRAAQKKSSSAIEKERAAEERESAKLDRQAKDIAPR